MIGPLVRWHVTRSWLAHDAVITAAVTANAKGSWTEVAASTARDGNGLVVQLYASSGSNRDYLLDLAVGVSGSEQLVVRNLFFSSRNPDQEAMTLSIPRFHIPKGSRLAARLQSSVGSSVVGIAVMAGVGRTVGGPLLQRTRTYGDVESSATSGTSIDPGGSAHADGSLVQLVSSLALDTYALSLFIGNQKNSSRVTGTWLLDLLLGAANDEQPLIDDIFLESHVSPDTVVTSETFWFTDPIPKGSRVTARSRSSITDATDRLFDLVLVAGGL